MAQDSSADSAAEIREARPEQSAEADAPTEAPDVLPEWANVVLASLWVILFAGRWLLVPVVQMAGVLPPDTLAAWDDGIGHKTYLILLVITLVVLGLRAARGAQKPRYAA